MGSRKNQNKSRCILAPRTLTINIKKTSDIINRNNILSKKEYV